MSEVKGYKVFNHDWTCRGFQYEVGKTFEEDVTPNCCNRGFHFCTKASDCFSYYNFRSENKVAEVVALGDVDTNKKNTKCCTNKILIVREITWQELLTIVNTGKDCTGLCNTGDWNAGDCNTGNRNTGNRNTGDWNAGDCNTGNYNTGNCNTGNCNAGNRNTGDWNAGNRNTGNRNTGNCNTGDWNKSSFNTGCFMTEEQKIMLFNKPSDWSYIDWVNSNARYLLQKILNRAVCGQLWWDGLSEDDKKTIMEIPNFDANIFLECTGIDVEK